MKTLLVEPSYYSRYPPLGLMKLAAYGRSMDDEIRYVRGLDSVDGFVPKRIEITSLFTYAWKPVHSAIEHYHSLFPDAEICVGGIYASLLPDNIRLRYPYVKVNVGLHPRAERYMPDYDILEQVEKWRGWDASIIFTSRGCVNRCTFCMVPVLEGSMKSVLNDPMSQVHPSHKRIILWDNNFLALPDWKEKMRSMSKSNLWVDFNQGLDARQMTKEKAEALSELKIKEIRMAYDGEHERDAAHRATDLLENAGFRRRNISFYTLYNFYDSRTGQFDTPESFYDRVKDILEMGCVSYPMRFVPFNTLSKNGFISPKWSESQLEAVAKARRVIGFGGAFPPYKALVDKIVNAEHFDEAFRLESPSSKEVLS